MVSDLPSPIRRRALAAALFVWLPLAWAAGLELQVKVQDENGRSVPDATVALVEIDATSFTDGGGMCSFPGLADGPYTVYVTAPGFREKRTRIEKVPAPALTVVLQTELVQMEGVEVEAENANPQPSVSSSAFGAEDMARLATGGDPASLADYGPGVSFPTLVLGACSAAADDLPSAAGRRARLYADGGASVYGSDPDLDGVSFDAIDLPASRHPLTGGSILPQELLKGLSVHRGIGPVTGLPAAGLSVILQSDDGVPARSTVSAGAALPGSLEFLGRFPLSSGTAVTASVRKSVFDAYGDILSSATGAADPSATGLLASNGDFLLSFLRRDGANRIRVDALGFADAAMDWSKAAGTDPIAALLSGESATGPGVDGTGFAALGGSWAWSPSAEASNTLSADVSLYGTRSRLAVYEPTSGTYGTSHRSTASVLSVSASDAAQWSPSDSLTLSGGLRARYDAMEAGWNGASVLDRPYALLAYPYAQLRWKSGNLLSQTGAGAWWLPISGLTDIGPVLSQEVTLFIPPAWSTGLRAAWGAGVYSPYSFLKRRIEEAALGLSSVTSADVPPKAFTAEAFLQDDFSAAASASLRPYFAWRYDLSGYTSQAVYVETSGTTGTRTLRALDAFEGWAAGCDLSAQAGAEDLRWSAGYTLGWSMLDTGTLGWVSANGDARHTLRAQASWKPTADFQAGLGALLLIDLPCTPSGGAFNAARDYVPRQRVDLNVRWEFRASGLEGALFLNATNLLCYLNPVASDAGTYAVAAFTAAPFSASVGAAGMEIGASLKF